jgi:hypothetical protein
MDDIIRPVFEEGQSEPLNSAVMKVMLAINDLDGTMFENLISMRTGLSVVEVQEAFRELDDAGYIETLEARVADGDLGEDDDFTALLADV